MPVRLGDISNSIVDTHLKFVHVYQKKLGIFYTYFFWNVNFKRWCTSKHFPFYNFFFWPYVKKGEYRIFMPVRLGDILSSIVDTHLKFVHVYQKKLGTVYTYFFQNVNFKRWCTSKHFPFYDFFFLTVCEKRWISYKICL